MEPNLNRAAAFAARYGASLTPAGGPWNEVIAGLMEHRSVRAFRPDPLPEGTVETLVAAAQILSLQQQSEQSARSRRD